MAGAVDLRKLYARLASLTAIRTAAEQLLAETAYQPPIDPLDTAGYYLAPAARLADLRAHLAAAAELESSSGEPRARLRIVDAAMIERAAAPAPALEIVVPFTPDRRNATNKATRHAKWQYRDTAHDREKSRVTKALAEWQTLEPRFVRPVSLEVEIAWGKLPQKTGKLVQAVDLDSDGAAGTLKAWLDAMTAIGIWADDRLASGDLRIVQRRSGNGEGYTAIRIRERDLELSGAPAARRRNLAV